MALTTVRHPLAAQNKSREMKMKKKGQERCIHLRKKVKAGRKTTNGEQERRKGTHPHSVLTGLLKTYKYPGKDSRRAQETNLGGEIFKERKCGSSPPSPLPSPSVVALAAAAGVPYLYTHWLAAIGSPSVPDVVGSQCVARPHSGTTTTTSRSQPTNCLHSRASHRSFIAHG